jgi:hypothetical protein
VVDRDHRFGSLDTADRYHAVSEHLFRLRLIAVQGSLARRLNAKTFTKFPGSDFNSRQARNLMIKVRSLVKGVCR